MADSKLLPHSLDSEEGVLGSLLIDGAAIHKIASFLKGEHFFYAQNQYIYDACFALFTRGESIDEITIGQELERCHKLEQCGGAANLSRLISITPTSLDIDNYANIVYRLWQNRELIRIGNRFIEIGHEARPDFGNSMSEAEQTLFALESGGDDNGLVHINKILGEFLEPPAIENDGQPLPFILTGFIDLDELLGGLKRTDLTLLAGRPGAGKTSLALAIARNVALDKNGCVAIFSLEMAREELVMRLLSSESMVDADKFGVWHKEEIVRTDDEEYRLVKAIETLSECPIYIDDTPVARLSEIRGKARRLQHEHQIDLIIIDHLGLIQSDDRGGNRVSEVTNISKQLKGLARTLRVPVLALSQLNRASEHREDPKPKLVDLRESGSLEQDADNVLFIFRESYYYTPDQWRLENPNRPYPDNEADAILSKHRSGATGEVKLRFERRLVKFSNFGNRQG